MREKKNPIIYCLSGERMAPSPEQLFALCVEPHFPAALKFLPCFQLHNAVSGEQAKTGSWTKVTPLPKRLSTFLTVCAPISVLDRKQMVPNAHKFRPQHQNPPYSSLMAVLCSSEVRISISHLLVFAGVSVPVCDKCISLPFSVINS